MKFLTAFILVLLIAARAAFAQGLSGSSVHPGFDPKRPPPLALPEAYALANARLASATNGFFCVSATCVEPPTCMTSGWRFVFSNTNGEVAQVKVFFNKDVYIAPHDTELFAGGLKMVLSLSDVQGLVSNEPPILVAMITNMSETTAQLGLPTVGPPIWYSISSPSGIDLSSGEPGTRPAGSATTSPIVNPHESMIFRRQLNLICPLMGEAGVYVFTAKVRVFISGTNFVLTSNPQIISFSESDIKNMPKRPKGF